MHVISVNVSAALPIDIGGRSELTGIVKRGVTGPVQARAMGLDGDEQADLSVLGGLSKAVYALSLIHI